MSKEYVVVVDSMADFPVGFESPDIRIVKTPVTIGDDDYTYATVDEFYDKQREVFGMRDHSVHTPIKTAAPMMVEIEEEMHEILESGKDAIYVATASTLTSAIVSGRNACIMLEEDYEDEGLSGRVIAIDGLSMSVLTSVLVRAALNKCDRTDEFIDFIFDRRNDTEHFFMVEEWEAFRASGRISKKTLLLANLIGIKPLMRFDFDETGTRKAFCEKKALDTETLAVYAAKKLKETIDPEYPVATIIHAQNERGAKEFSDAIRKYAPGIRIVGDPDLNPEYRMGQATGVHLGYSAVGLAFLRAKNTYENAEKHREDQELEDAEFEICF